MLSLGSFKTGAILLMDGPLPNPYDINWEPKVAMATHITVLHKTLMIHAQGCLAWSPGLKNRSSDCSHSVNRLDSRISRTTLRTAPKGVCSNYIQVHLKNTPTNSCKRVFVAARLHTSSSQEHPLRAALKGVCSNTATYMVISRTPLRAGLKGVCSSKSTYKQVRGINKSF